MVTAFLNIARYLHALEFGLQPLGFLALGAAGHGLLQGRALPAVQKGGRYALGTIHVGLACPSSYLTDTLSFKADAYFQRAMDWPSTGFFSVMDRGSQDFSLSGLARPPHNAATREQR